MARRTKDEARATREGILDAAEREFERHGVSRTSLQSIARTAGVTRGAIYWHFSDKADLFNAMLNRMTLPLEAEINRSSGRDIDDPVGHMRRSFLAALRATAQNDQARRVFEIATFKVEHLEDVRGIRERRLNGLRTRVGHLERGFRRAARLGQVSGRVPARAAAIGLHSLLDGLIQNWMLEPAAFDLVRTGERAIDAYLAGLAVPATV